MTQVQSILITGYSGYVGHQVANLLSARGYSITGTCRKAPVDAKHSILVGEHSDQNFWHEALHKQDLVIHFAALTRSHDPKTLYLHNEKVTEALSISLKQYPHIRFIHISSDHAVTSSGPYGISKKNCEKIVHKHNPDAIILRLTAVIGEYQKQSKNTFCKIISALKKYPLLFIPGYKLPINPTNVYDITDALCQLISHGEIKAKTYELTGEATNLEELITHFENRLKVKRWKLIIPIPWIKPIVKFMKKFKLLSFLPLDALILLGKPLEVTYHQLEKDLNFKPCPLAQVISKIANLP